MACLKPGKGTNMIIINAKILTMENEDYENGYLTINDGLISAIGDMKDCPPVTGQEVVDAGGGLLLPGFIDAHSHMGMWEDSLDFEGDDGNEDTDPVTPQLRAVDAVNPMDRCFSEALAAGVTTVLTGPGSANPIGGLWCAMKTFGRRIDDMLLEPAAGMKFALGENPKNVYHGKNQTPVTRMATAALIREQLAKAKRYMEDKRLAEEDHENYDEPEYDAKCEALLPVLAGKMKAVFHAHRADDIFTAIRLAKEFQLDYILVHCTEGYRIADLLREEHAKVIAGPILCDRSKPELSSLDPKGPGILWNAGVPCAICTDHPVIPIQYLPLCAAIAEAEGLGYREALEAITILPARLFGLDDRIGSLKVGKQADVALYDTDPLGVCARPKQVWLDGKKVIG